ncbi:hypothetical protein ABK040_004652 [Willaertia magna]
MSSSPFAQTSGVKLAFFFVVLQVLTGVVFLAIYFGTNPRFNTNYSNVACVNNNENLSKQQPSAQIPTEPVATPKPAVVAPPAPVPPAPKIPPSITQQSIVTTIPDNGIPEVYLLTIVSIDHDVDVFEYFIQYYVDVLKISPKNVRIILHTSGTSPKEVYDKKYGSIMSSLTRRGITVNNVWNGKFDSFEKHAKLNKLLEETVLVTLDKDGKPLQLDKSKKIKAPWLVHADVDEFLDFPPITSLPDIITGEYIKAKQIKYQNQQNYESPIAALERFKIFMKYLQDTEYEAVKGFMEDQVATNCDLYDLVPPTESDVTKGFNGFKELLDKYPCRIDVSYLLLRNDLNLMKSPIYKIYARATDGGHHMLTNEKTLKRFPLMFPVYHFKWRKSVKPKLVERAKVFKEKNIPWWTQSQQFVDQLQKDKIETPGCPCTRRKLFGLSYYRALVN